MDWNEWLQVVVSTLVGGVIGWVLGLGSSRRITETHAKLTLLMTALAAERTVTFKYDDKGRPVGVVLEASGTVRGTSSVTGSTTLKRAPVKPSPAPAEEQ